MKIQLYHSPEYRVGGKHCSDAWQSDRKTSASWRTKEERMRVEYDEVLISTRRIISSFFSYKKEDWRGYYRF